MPFWDKLFRKKGADPMADEQQNVENTAEDTEVKVDTEAEVKAEAEAQTEGAEEKADNNSEVEALKAKAAETEDKLLRLRADFENFRRRTRQLCREGAWGLWSDVGKDRGRAMRLFFCIYF